MKVTTFDLNRFSEFSLGDEEMMKVIGGDDHIPGTYPIEEDIPPPPPPPPPGE